MIRRPYQVIVERPCGLKIFRNFALPDEAMLHAQDKIRQSPQGCRIRLVEVDLDAGAGGEKRVLLDQLVRRLGPGGPRSKTQGKKTFATDGHR